MRFSLSRPTRAACAAGLLALGLAGVMPARAHSEASAALSLLPVASVVVASAHGTVYVLERASDGAQASIALAGRASAGVGTVVTVSVVGTGVLLSAAGEVLAFVPNAIGQALLYSERL